MRCGEVGLTVKADIKVKYGETAIMTFMTGHDGVVYERDLSPDTTKSSRAVCRRAARQRKDQQ